MLIKGVEISEETIVSALTKAGISLEKPKPYQFQAGDVVNYYDDKRLIVRVNNKLYAVDKYGNVRCSNSEENFDGAEYEKIGVISDFIK